MGFSYKKVNNIRILCEQSHVKAMKVKFIKKYRQYLESWEDVIFIYLDEAWIYRNGSEVRKWIYDTDVEVKPKRVKSEGKKFAILHAGCENVPYHSVKLEKLPNSYFPVKIHWVATKKYKVKDNIF